MRILEFSLKMDADCPDPGKIILSFDSKWLDAINASSFSCVLRKMGPQRFQPTCIYAYLAKPTSAIVARFPVTAYEKISVTSAISLASNAMLTPEEISKYANNSSNLVVYHVGKITLAQKPIHFEHLKEAYQFWPSSNYIPLSPEGADELNKLGDFS
jgi:predicted transcriptional regulator